MWWRNSPVHRTKTCSRSGGGGEQLDLVRIALETLDGAMVYVEGDTHSSEALEVTVVSVGADAGVGPTQGLRRVEVETPRMPASSLSSPLVAHHRKCDRCFAPTASALANRPLPANADLPPPPARSCGPPLNTASQLRRPHPSTAPPRLRLRRSVPSATAPLLHHRVEWCRAERK